MRFVVKEGETVLGSVMTNRSLSFDEVMELAGFTWQYSDEWQTEGWSNDDGETCYSASDIHP